MMHMASFFRNVCLNRENVLKIFTYLWIHSVWNNFVSYPVVFQLIWFSSMLQCLAFTHIEIRHIISGVKWKLLSYKANNVCAFSSMGEIADANAFELLRIWVWFVWYNIRDSPPFRLVFHLIQRCFQLPHGSTMVNMKFTFHLAVLSVAC